MDLKNPLPMVSVTVINYNGRDFLKSCLRSLRREK